MIFVALGANLPSRYGQPHETLCAARCAMEARGVKVTAVSSTWLTAPVPVSDQPWYHNEVVCVETVLSPAQLLAVLHAIEGEFGRVRTARNAPRLLDLDLIAYDDVVLDTLELTVPHARMHERAFVLLPLREIATDNWVHPVLKTALGTLVAALSTDQEAKKRGGSLL